jgi:L-fuconolactonase
MKIIDPHIHFFDVILGDYGWLKQDSQPYWPDKNMINRSFAQDDLALNLPLSLAGFVHIEAGFDNKRPWREIKWLEQTVTLPFRSIASADITLSPEEFTELITKLCHYKSVVGIRHIFDEGAVDILSNVNALTNLQYLAAQQLIFETQIFGCDDLSVDLYCEMAREIPTLSLVLGHAAFCPQDKAGRSKWIHNIQNVANCTNVSIKASGWEMISRSYTQHYVDDVVSQLLNCFGENRVMLGSNFPLSTFSKTYNELWTEYSLNNLSIKTRNKLTFLNASSVYRILESGDK